MNMEDIEITVSQPQQQSLPRLAPCGLGTGQIESLSSYIVRLARALTYSPYEFFTRWLGWFAFDNGTGTGEIHSKAAVVARTGASLSRSNGPAIAQALQRLTGQRDLENLTAASLGGIFSEPGMMRAHRCWCDRCLATDEVPYDRLLWTLESVTHCPIHRQVLSHKCPRCDAKQPHLPPSGAADRCARCGSELHSGVSTHVAEPDGFEVWSARTTAKLIADLQATQSMPTSESLRRGIVAGVDVGKVQSTCGLSRALGGAKNTVWYWLEQRLGVRLHMAQRIAWIYGVELTDLANGIVHASSMPRLPTWNGHQRTTRAERTPTVDDVLLAIRRFRMDAPLVRPTKRAIAQVLSITEWSTVLGDPRVEEYLSRGQTTAARMRHALEVWDTCEAMRDAARAVADCGRPFTQRAIRHRLERRGVKEGMLRAPFAQQFFFRLRNAHARGDLRLLQPHPPPKVIRPLLALAQ